MTEDSPIDCDKIPATPFSMACPNCGVRLKVENPALVGKRVACPKCKSPLLIRPVESNEPMPASTPACRQKEAAQPKPFNWKIPALIGSGGVIAGILIVCVFLLLARLGNSEVSHNEPAPADEQMAISHTSLRPPPPPPSGRPARQMSSVAWPVRTQPSKDAPLGEIIERVDNAIVFISSQDHLGRTVCLGSGFVIYRSGLIATNYHVISDAAAATVKFRDTSLGELAEPCLFEVKHLAIGRKAANIVGRDSKGIEFQLSDYAGKVTLLDFWVDWCPYCRRMYPHERLLLKEYKDKPFALLGVNCDQTARLTRVLDSKNVVWRSWADGPGGPIATKWNVTGYPTVYLLDHHGRVRSKGNLSGQKLDTAIALLMKEQELGLPDNLIPPCSAWTYFDAGTDPGENWPAIDYDDSAWHSGRAPLGYGEEDEATVVRFGPNPQYKNITTYFRTTFQATDVTNVNDLVLGLICDDGAAVYLNGQEAVRHNLPPKAKYDDPALRKAPDDGKVRRYFSVDPGLLVEGENVIAVEVHQDQAESSDIRFDLTLSSNTVANVAESLADKSPLARREALTILTELGPAAKSAIPQVREVLKSDDPILRSLAIGAILHMMPQWYRPGARLPDLESEEEAKVRAALAQAYNNRSWHLAKRAGLSEFLYAKALRSAKASLALGPDNAAAVNTLGVAQYRAGNYQAAIACLTKSRKTRGDNPHDAAFLAMANHRLGRTDRARRSLQCLWEFMKQSKWAKDEEALAFAREAAAIGKRSKG